MSMVDYFNCFVCGEIPESPYESECCGKLYCHSCSENSSDLRCRYCSKALKFRVCAFAKNVMKTMETNCRFGCEAKYKISDTRKHNLHCKSKVYICTVKKCSYFGTRENLIKHVSELHSRELLVLMENFDLFKSFFDKYNFIDSEPKKKKKEMSVPKENATQDFSNSNFMNPLNTAISNNLENNPFYNNTTKRRYNSRLNYYDGYLGYSNKDNKDNTVVKKYQPIKNNFIDNYKIYNDLVSDSKKDKGKK